MFISSKRSARARVERNQVEASPPHAQQRDAAQEEARMGEETLALAHFLLHLAAGLPGSLEVLPGLPGCISQQCQADEGDDPYREPLGAERAHGLLPFVLAPQTHHQEAGDEVTQPDRGGHDEAGGTVVRDESRHGWFQSGRKRSSSAVTSVTASA